NEVNVRTGPGTRYPIQWVYLRRGWPVEVIEEYELWLQIRDIDGDTGWVHRNLLSGRRTLVITGRCVPFMKTPMRRAQSSCSRSPAFLASLRSVTAAGARSRSPA